MTLLIDLDSFWEGARYNHKLSWCWEVLSDKDMLENYLEISDQMLGETFEEAEEYDEV